MSKQVSPTPWPGSNPNKASEEFISPAEKEKFLEKLTLNEITKAERVYCLQCGASYAAEWAGTACSLCDGDIA